MFNRSELKGRAATAVRLQLPKNSFQELIVFFSEDQLRYKECKKYILYTIPLGDKKRFLPNVFRRVISLRALGKGDLPDVLVKLVTEVALEGAVYQDEDAVRVDLRQFVLKVQGMLESRNLKNPEDCRTRSRKRAGNKSSDDDSPKLVRVVLRKVNVILQYCIHYQALIVLLFFVGCPDCRQSR